MIESYINCKIKYQNNNLLHQNWKNSKAGAVRGEGFEPSNPLRDRILSPAPLTRLGHPRIILK